MSSHVAPYFQASSRHASVTEVFDPAALGFFEKSEGSGVWYHPTKSGTYSPGNCKFCAGEFMKLRIDPKYRRGQFCSTECAGLHKRSDTPGYFARHVRVRTARGSASLLPCEDCGNPAYEWSQRKDTSGDNPEDYDPRCRPCHSAYDKEVRPHGITHGSNKLSELQVRTIREEYATGTVTQDELAARYNVVQSLISVIVHNKLWRHL